MRGYLTSDEYAERVGKSLRTIQKHCAAGKLPHKRFGAGKGSVLLLPERDATPERYRELIGPKGRRWPT